MSAGSSNTKLLKGSFLPLLACLFISASLWVLVQTSKWDNYSFYINFNLEGVPKNYRMLGNNTNQTLVKQNTTGLNFLYNQIFQKNRFNFDFQQAKLHPYSGSVKYLLLHELIKEQNLLHTNGSSVMSVDPDTLFFEFGKIYSKKVPLVVRFQGKLKEGYFPVSNPVPSVKSVKIRGKKSILKNIDTLILKAEIPDELSSDAQVNVKLPQNGALSFLEMIPSSVNCRIKIEKYTEKRIEVKIKTANVPKGMKVKLLPDKCILKTSIPLSYFENVTDNLFEITADFSAPVKNNRARLVLNKTPNYCMNPRLENSFVEFILIK